MTDYAKRVSVPSLAGDTIMRISINKLKDLIDTRHDGNVSAAAKAWGLEQSHLHRALKAERTLKVSALGRIAKIEHVDRQLLVEPESPQPQLKVLAKQGGSAPRLVYDVNDPAGMLLQAQSWFADVPDKDRMRTHLIRAVIRSMFDHSFDEVHKPTTQWRVVMEHLDGWTSSANRDRRRSRA